MFLINNFSKSIQYLYLLIFYRIISIYKGSNELEERMATIIMFLFIILFIY